MMTVPMDNLSAPTSRELDQRLQNKNIEFENKRRKSSQARIPADPNAWQQARENYEAMILEDHASSEQNGIVYALWQLHYKRIEELRAHFSAALAPAESAASQGAKGPARPDRIKRIRSQLKAFLSEATGFYHDLILKIQAKYGLTLGYFSEDSENQITMEKDGNKSSEMKKGLISCHRCLIYLGDLARYKGLYGEGDSKNLDFAAASSYYMQAASLWPSSGNPHHQLAILASYSGDDLVAVYRYFRSLAVNAPFSTTRDNLVIAFEKNRQSYSQLPGDTKASSVKTVPVQKTGKGGGDGEKTLLPKNGKLEATPIKETTLSIPETYRVFCIRFVRLNGILFTRTSLETFGEVFSLVSSNLCELLSSGPEEVLNFCSDAAENGLIIVRLIAILIFTIHNVNRETEGHSYSEILQRSVLLQNAFSAAFQFVGHILERCLQLRDLSSSYLLPGILVFVEWLACRPNIAVGSDMEEKQATASSFFWNHFISFLNKLMSSRFAFIDGDDNDDETCFFNMSRYDEGETSNRLALWEDFELRGFLPLLPAQCVLDFSRKHSTGSDGGDMEKGVRIHRILAAGRALANVVRIDQQVIYFDQKLKNFAIGVESQISKDSVLTSASEMPKSNSTRENPIEKTGNIGVIPPKAQLYMEGEEEDEVIVFKPTVAEKLGNMPSPNLTIYEVLGPGVNNSKDEWVGYVGSITAPLSNLVHQNDLDVNRQTHASFANMAHQHLEPIDSGASKRFVEQQAHLAYGMKNLGVGNGLYLKSELHEGLRASQPLPLSFPFPQSANLTAGSMSYDQRKVPEAVIPSKLDSIVPSVANGESLTVNPSVTLPVTSRKNPVSRPVRHLGPPPGFSHVPPKPADGIMVGSDLKNENPPLDDYSWLDGYQLSSSTKGVTPITSINHTALVYPSFMNNSNDLPGTINFPFPGKQVPTMQVKVENHKSWQDSQLLEHLKLYREQQPQQLQPQQAQNSAPLPEQYQGQSLWSDRFFV